MSSSYHKIEKIREKQGHVKLGLIDPDKKNDSSIITIIDKIEKNNFDGILIGGSSIADNHYEDRIIKIVQRTSLPTIIFPGSSNQLSKYVDSILYLNLISGRNPKFLIEEQVKGAFKIYKYKLHSIPTAYILLDGKNNSSVAKISKTKPLSMNDKKIILNHSLAGEYLGNKIIYFDNGSGAKSSIDLNLLQYIKQYISVPIMVGGGIKTIKQINELIDNGASYIVCGTMFESTGE